MADNENADKYLVLLEQIQGQVEVVTEGHEQLNYQIERTQSSLQEEIHVFRSEVRLGFKKLTARVDQNSHDIRDLKTTVDRNSRDIRALTSTVDQNSRE